MRNYRTSTVMKMIHYVLLHHHMSLFLLPHFKQRLLKLLPPTQQQWTCHGLRGRSSLTRKLPHIQKSHPLQQIIGNLNERVTRCSRSAHHSCFMNTLFVVLFEPRDVKHAHSDLSWVNAMHEELDKFKRNQVWTLVEPPHGVNVIGTK
jgi:hypothetical protein